MAVRIIHKPKPFKVTFKGKESPTQLLFNVASDYRIDVVERTLKGVDKHHHAFKQYSFAYREAKMANKVYGQREASNGQVNLKLSRDLLRSLHIEKKANSSLVYPQVNGNYGYYHQVGAGNLPKREWWGLSKVMIKKYSAMIKKAIKYQ